MNERVKKALECKKNGYNCAQSVVCAYCDLFGMDENTAFRFSEGFGGGMGGMQETCGAVTAAFMLIGLENSSGCLEKPNSKVNTYSKVKELAQNFKNKNGSLICKELKGITGGSVLRSCEGCIEDACLLFEEYLNTAKCSKSTNIL